MPGLIDIPFDAVVTILSIPRHLLTSGEGIRGIWKDAKALPRRVWNDTKGAGTYVLGKPAINMKLRDFDPAILGE